MQIERQWWATRVNGHRKKGRPKLRWRDVNPNDMNEKPREAQDRRTWMKSPCIAPKLGKGQKNVFIQFDLSYDQWEHIIPIACSNRLKITVVTGSKPIDRSILRVVTQWPVFMKVYEPSVNYWPLPVGSLRSSPSQERPLFWRYSMGWAVQHNLQHDK